MIISTKPVSLKPAVTYLEYIQSSGSQWIDTGVSAPDGFDVILDISITSVLGSNLQNCVLGAHRNSAPYGRNFLSFVAGYYQLGEGDGMQNFGVPYPGMRVTVEASNIYGSEYAKINGTNQTLQPQQTPSGDYADGSLFLLYINGGESYFSPVAARIYSASITVGGSIVRDYRPAKAPGGSACLYDEVSKTYFQNAGSGSFTAGPEV